jgi:DNA segregation ATPase FtsK/SpoIIIE-like protein
VADKQDEILKKLESIDKRLKNLENDFYNLDDYLPNHSLINKSIQFIEKKGKVSRDELKKRFGISDFRAIKLIELLAEYGFINKKEDEDGTRKVEPEAFFQSVEPNIIYTNDDEMFKKAAEIVQEYDQASASLLQRRLSIGYARAASILDKMEAKGIVGPAVGAKPRQVLKK